MTLSAIAAPDEHEVEVPHRRRVEPEPRLATPPGADAAARHHRHQSVFFTGAGA